MKELLRSNDPVRLSWLTALLADAGIESILFDQHTSILEGSIGAIQRRMMVDDDDLARAQRVLRDAGETPMTEALLTEDGLLDGRVRLFQPAEGFRAAIDPVLLAAAARAEAGERVIDLGCGSGAAMLCLGARVPGLELIGLDADPAAVDLALRNLAANGHVGGRALRWTAGSGAPPANLEPADLLITNPPFHDGRGTAAAAPRQAAKRDRLGAAAWFGAAAGLLGRRGRLVAIWRADRLPEAITGLAEAFGALEILPLWPRAGQPAKRVLLRAVRGSGAASSLLPGLVLHEADGRFTPAAEAVLRHAAAIV